MTMPNFLIIGTAKAGTSALYRYMKQHPEIYMPRFKEPRFFALESEKVTCLGPGDNQRFNRRTFTNINDYLTLFQGVSNEKAVGEASTLYLYNPRTPGRIKYYVPNMRLIAILRDPAERAYSAFLHLVREGWEPLIDFKQALRKEEMRIRGKWEPLWHYKGMGFYYGQLKRYFDIFDQKQIKVYLYEDFKTYPIDTLQNIFHFLGLDETFTPNMSTKPNVSGIPKNKRLHSFLVKPSLIKKLLKPFLPTETRWRLKNILKNKNLVKPALHPEVRQQLIELYKEDIFKTQELIQRDLSKWLK